MTCTRCQLHTLPYNACIQSDIITITLYTFPQLPKYFLFHIQSPLDLVRYSLAFLRPSLASIGLVLVVRTSHGM